MPVNSWVAVGLLLGLAGCGNMPALEAPLNVNNRESSTLPPCVDDDCNCEDFRDQALAQLVLEAFPQDPFVLDRDRNGQACESLPSTSPELGATGPASESPHLILGNPSHASTEQPSNLLIERSQYALSYNRERGTANWASWHLSADWLGQTERQDTFRQDGSLPAGSYQVTPNDYRNSGFDRGHLVPSGDRTRNQDDNSITFLMTNILPQAPENNRGIWRELEEYSRELVYQFDHDLIVISGGYGQQATLAKGRITVPSRLWKIIVVLPRPNQGFADLGPDTLVIAVDMPNRNGIGPDWRTYQTTVDRIELATGYDFLSLLPPDLQATLEAVPSDLSSGP